jgi:ABC-2 type transport system ATP-binding protein
MSYAVNVSGVQKDYAGEHALAGISFSVDNGRLFGLIGADGAGKTTLLRSLATLSDVDNGTISVSGLDARKDFRTLRKKIGYMPQKFSLYQDLTVRENIIFFADIFEVDKDERGKRIERLLSFSHLKKFQDRKSRDLSGGMKQKLALSCALIHTPEILFLDEPTTGVDPVSRREFWNILFDLKKQGVTIIVSTPYMDEARMCDDLMFLHHGQIVRKGSPDELLSKYPYNLFSINGKNGKVLFYPQSGEIPESIRLIYPAEGTLHIATDKNFCDSEKILTIIKTVIPEAFMIKAINPEIEDLFTYLLSDNKQ